MQQGFQGTDFATILKLSYKTNNYSKLKIKKPIKQL